MKIDEEAFNHEVSKQLDLSENAKRVIKRTIFYLKCYYIDKTLNLAKLDQRGPVPSVK